MSREGFLKKRTGRLQRWSRRYFTLQGPHLSYRLKSDLSSPTRGEFDLVADCVVTEVSEETTASIKGGRVFSFWIVWPHSKSQKTSADESAKDEAGKDLGEDSDDDDASVHQPQPVQSHQNPNAQSAPKELKDIVKNEVMTQKRQQKQAEEQLESHRAHDHNVSLGAKVAAVAVGGAVVGALTAGIGLVPYLAVVGIATVAGGGAVALNYRKPVDSRIILACDSMEEAIAWHDAITEEINKLERSRKPALPASADADTISFMMCALCESNSWRKVANYEGMRVLEMKRDDNAKSYFLCRKAQLVMNCTPINIFLALMESQIWPKGGVFKVDRAIDDHADEVSVEIRTTLKKKEITRKLKLSRFWKLDDDGTYLITMNTLDSGSIASEDKSTSSEEAKPPSVDMVFTIAPRKDNSEYDDDISAALVTAIVQVSSTSTTPGSWAVAEVEDFVNEALKQSLLDLRCMLLAQRYRSDVSKLPMATAIAAPLPTGGSGSNLLGNGSQQQQLSQSQPPNSALVNSPVQTATKSKWFSRSHRQGITTMQPGLDDASQSSYDRQAAINAADTEPVAAKRGFFRKAFSTGSSTGGFGNNSSHGMMTPARGLDDSTHSQSVSSSVPNPTPKSANRSSVRRKSLNVNPEAAKLRRELAAKEYELQRVEKLLKKKSSEGVAGSTGGSGNASSVSGNNGTNNNNNNNNNNNSGSNNGSVDLKMYQDLLKDLHEMKVSYLHMTGCVYEQQSRHRKGLGRLFGKDPNAQAIAATATSSSNSMASSTATMVVPDTPLTAVVNIAPSQATSLHTITAPRASKILTQSNKQKELPSHWILPKSEDSNNEEETSFVKLVVALFVLSMIMSLMMSKIEM